MDVDIGVCWYVKSCDVMGFLANSEINYLFINYGPNNVENNG